jgi:hypothetical protein
MYWENVLRAHAGLSLRIIYGKNKDGTITKYANVHPAADGKTAEILTLVNAGKTKIVTLK